ncbi:hypothetical protein BVG19_g2523 [[Candida] boidinii]|nr:hypothetical protein BVG19_g2523 [[Candida] boidinii]OWB50474.1 hypothetical protein B5S27_g2024 [[Candida] boidinii]
MSFRGTPISEESLNKKKEKDLKDLKFDKSFNKKVDLSQVNKAIIIKWISKRLDELIPDDDIIVSFLLNLIFGDNYEQFINDDEETDTDINSKNTLYEIENNFPDIKEIHSQLIPFLGDETLGFTKELWELMLSAQDDKDGIPPKLIHMMEEELKRKEELKALRDIERKEKEAKMRVYINNRGRVGKERFNDSPNYNNRTNSNNKPNYTDFRNNRNNNNNSTENYKYQGKPKRSDLPNRVSKPYNETRSERKPYDPKKLEYNSTKKENEIEKKEESTELKHELLLRKIDLEKKAILEKIKEKELKIAEDDVDRYRDRRPNTTIMKEISEIKNGVEPASSTDTKDRTGKEKSTHDHHHRSHHHHHHHRSSSRSVDSSRAGASHGSSRSHRREEDKEHRSHSNSHSNRERRHNRREHHRREHHREEDSNRKRERSPSRSSKSKEAVPSPPPPPPLSPPPHLQNS